MRSLISFQKSARLYRQLSSLKRGAAEDTLLDRALVSVSPDAYAEFLKRLDAPAQSNERLRKTMQTLPPWARA